MRVLGIETSCDDTSVAIVENGRLLSNVVSSQTKIHAPFRGVVPELASRSHLNNLKPVLTLALKKVGLKKINAVAFTRGPGLMGPLLVGKVAAITLAELMKVPAIGVNHLEGHILAAGLEHRLRWPMINLIVSGGHTDLVLSHRPGRYKILGRTRDDAAGEAYDKVARLFGLKYPGGPEIDRCAKRGNPSAVSFPRPHIPGSWDFSFSGLKTSVLYYLRDHPGPIKGRRLFDLCASFQEAVSETLVLQTINAAKKFGAKNIAIGGGVAANSRLRELISEAGKKEKCNVYLPSRVLCTDNAAMIAFVGEKLLRAGYKSNKTRVDPSLLLRCWAA